MNATASTVSEAAAEIMRQLPSERPAILARLRAIILLTQVVPLAS